MAISPDSLLIFQARGIKETKPKRKKQQQTEASLPKGQEEAMLPPGAQQKPTQEKEKQPSPPKAAPPVSKEEKDKKIMEGLEELAREHINADTRQQNIRYTEQKSVYVAEKQSQAETAANLARPSRKAASPDRQKQSREEARSRTCAWHPWREAYATCGYCHRAFCFQDIVEFNMDYYCLEDIDNVSQYTEQNAGSPGNFAVISGVLLLASFLVFFYYSNAQVLYILKYLNSIGFFFFINHITITHYYSYAYALLESSIVALGLLSGLLLFVQSRKGFYLGTVACLSSVVLFSYQYLLTHTLYLGVVGLLMFAAFIALLLSRASYIAEEARTPLAAFGKNLVKWPNIGKF